MTTASKRPYQAGKSAKPPAPTHISTHNPVSEFSALSIRDLLDARDQYHIHLMRHPNVVATAVGYYRIRSDDSAPGILPVIKGEGERTLSNSEVRAYSWPAVLVFVKEWISPDDFGSKRQYDLDAMVPKTLYLPDGRRVPVCVILAPRDPVSNSEPVTARFPMNNIGSGNPVLVEVQGRTHIATVACLATDGHKVFALTNRHVTGDPGSVIESQLDGRRQPVGVTAPDQISRLLFSDVYPGWAGRSTYVNLDVGLIDVTDINQWTARLQGGEVMGPMVDLSSVDFPLSLIGRHVRGYGAASQWMYGEITALFYRYKSHGGFEYVADFFFGPRTPIKGEAVGDLITRPGDSGTLWLLEPEVLSDEVDGTSKVEAPRPLAMQWGANRLYSGLSSSSRPYALATCVSTACSRLDLDIIREWNLDQPDTWGAFGHFTIASRVAGALSAAVPKLSGMMREHADIITHPDDVLLDSEFKNMGSDKFVPLADVPDFLWKHGKQGFTRGSEGPNHFADMDHPRASDGSDLLKLCEDVNNIDPVVWDRFYDEVTDLLTGTAIEQKYRGLLPFRVWQIFDEMVGFVRDGKLPEFVCAAGVLTHYVADACQPLHISYLHDGDPARATSHTVHHHDGTTSDKKVAYGEGVHSAYEDAMISANRKSVLDGLDDTEKVGGEERIADGKSAAFATVELMRRTFTDLPPIDIVETYVAAKSLNDDVASALWKEFGSKTIDAMQAGTHLIAVLWESAWLAADGETVFKKFTPLTEDEAMRICEDRDFLRSMTIAEIGAQLAKAS